MDLITTATEKGLRFLFEKGVDQLRSNRMNYLAGKLAQGSIDINDPDIKTEPFLSSLINTADALQKASGHTKIDILTELFLSGVKTDKINTNTDEFHEILSSISELSERELVVLALCGECLLYSEPGLEGINAVEASGALYQSVATKLSVSQDEAIAIVCGLQRTGFIYPLNQPNKYPLYMRSNKYKALMTYIHLKNVFM